MEQEKSLFNLEIDSASKTYLFETAKWGKFLAIVGFISLGLVVLITIIVATTTQTPNEFENGPYTAGYIIGTVIGSLIICLIYFFPCLYLLRFSNQMKNSILSNDVTSMNEAFRNLKNTFRYMGVMTIICIALFGLGMLAGL